MKKGSLEVEIELKYGLALCIIMGFIDFCGGVIVVDQFCGCCDCIELWLQENEKRVFHPQQQNQNKNTI